MKKPLILIVIIIIAIICFSLLNQPLPQEDKIFVIKKGQTAKEISLNLEKEKLIKSKDFFLFDLYLQNKNSSIKAGEYLLNSSMKNQGIIEKINKGEVIKETITIIEGWTIKDINQYMESKGITGFSDLANNPSEELKNNYPFLKETNTLEGFLFPDTYYIEKQETAENIIKKMLSTFKEKTENKTITYETIIMASMLEKEVKTFEDKQVVAGVLYKRLEAHMPLQVDATILYVLNKNILTNEDKTIDSPYNTYKYKGMTIAPISNPGLESIEAAIKPKESNYWYYLSAKDGTTIFSKTFKEHNENIAKYLR